MDSGFTDRDFAGDQADLEEGMALQARGDASSAAVYYRRLYRRYPDNGLIGFLLAGVALEIPGADLEEAYQISRKVLAQQADNATVLLTHGRLCNALKLWPEAIDTLGQAITFLPALPDLYAQLKQPLVASGRARDLAVLLDRVTQMYDLLPMERPHEFFPRQESALERALPPILLVTIPKSGSLYVFNRLVDGLDAPPCRISLDLFPQDYVVPAWASILAKGGAVSQEHLDASAGNIAALSAAGIARLVVHVRDPRQAMLSWTHHVDTMVGASAYLRDLMSPVVPSGYDEWSFARKLDWQIDNHLPALVTWTEGWCRAKAVGASGIDILFTRYEDFRQDEDAFFARLLDFFGVPVTMAPKSTVKSKALHFRRGEAEEWRRVFDVEQQRRANALLAPELCQRFGWAPN